MVVNTYARDDARVILSAASLVELGYNVHLLGSARQKVDATVDVQQTYQGVTIQIVPHISRLRQLLKAFSQIITNNLPEQLSTSLAPTNLLSILLFNLWICRIAFSRPLDIIHCHDLSPLPACWVIAKLKKIPVIYDIHENVPTMHTGRKGKLMTWLEGFLAPETDYVIAAGHRLATAMLGRGAEPVIHIGNWKSLSDYDAVSQEDTHRLRQQWNIPQDAFVISFLGTLDKSRDIPALLDAVATSEDIYLMIGGRGDYKDLIIQYANQHNNIIWLKWVDFDDLPLYTVAADIMYYCRSDKMPGGSYELAPAPNKLYEAFAAGLPLIASRGVGEIGEILEQIPAAILLDIVSPETIKGAIEQLRQPAIYKAKREAALAARETYNLAKAREHLEHVYSTLIS